MSADTPPLCASPHTEEADLPWGSPTADASRPPQGFEGSYLGNREVLQPDSRLECKICWWVYDPTVGDPQWQIAAGTPFADLPSHWRCPNCDCEPDQFLLLP
jgi:rubredoxin